MTPADIVVLTGGVGGAKLVAGLCRELDSAHLCAIVNTGDDFIHLGLNISPDIDTLLYTLAGLADPDKGWGRHDESWNFMAALRDLGGEDWFALGDRDLALHVERTRRLAAGESLSQIICDLATRLGVSARIVPMSDDACPVFIGTEEGTSSFQDYFVARRCAPKLVKVDIDRPRAARPAAAALEALASPSLRAILIAPSNPWLSIDPILAVPGLANAMRAASAPIIAVTPLPGGRAVKGPTAKIMEELGLDRTLNSIVDHYGGLIDGIVIDDEDSDPKDIAFLRTDTLMKSDEDKAKVAGTALALADMLRK